MVAEGSQVIPHLAHQFIFQLTLEEVEIGRALENISRVQ
jgi:hypothetical protein